MGEAYSGQCVWAAIGIQSQKGTPATNYVYIQPDSISGGVKKPESIDSSRRVGIRFKAPGHRGGYEVPFSISLELTPANAGILLHAALGTESGSITVGVYTHEFSITEKLSYITVLLYTAGLADDSGQPRVRQITDAKISKFSIKGEMDKPVIVDIEGIGCDVNPIVVPAGIIFPPDDPYFVKSTKGALQISIGSSLITATPFEESQSVNLEINNNISSDKRIDNTAFASGMREGESSLTGTANNILNTETIRETIAFEENEPRAIKLDFNTTQTITGSDTKQMVIDITEARYNDSEPSYDPDVMTNDMPFDVDVSKGLTVTLIDDNSHLWDASFTPIA